MRTIGGRPRTLLQHDYSVGGVTIDALGNIYVADFAEIVWKLTPEGERREFSMGLYGASGSQLALTP